MDRWFVLFTKPRKESQVEQELERRDITAFLPVMTRRRRGQMLSRPRPLFPRYLFAQLDESKDSPADLQWLPGLSYFVRADDEEYAIVDDKVIEYMRWRLEMAGRRGNSPFKQGQPVRLPVDHPLGPLDAVFDEDLSDGVRAYVLIEILGRLVRAEVNIDELDAVMVAASGPK